MKRTIPFTKTITFRTMIAEITDIEVKHSLKLTNDDEIEGDILVDGTYKMTDASQIEEEFHYKLPFMIELGSNYDTRNMEIAIGDFYFEIINEEDLKINVEIDINGLEEKEELVQQSPSKLVLDNVDDKNDDIEELELYNSKLVRANDNDDAIPIPVEVDEVKEKLEIKTNDDPLDKLNKQIEEDIKMDTVESINSKVNDNNNNNNNNNLAVDNAKQSTNVGSIFSSLSSSEETFSTYYVYIVRDMDTIESIIDKYKTTREELQNYNNLDEVKAGSKLIIPCCNNE